MRWEETKGEAVKCLFFPVPHPHCFGCLYLWSWASPGSLYPHLPFHQSLSRRSRSALSFWNSRGVHFGPLTGDFSFHWDHLVPGQWVLHKTFLCGHWGQKLYWGGTHTELQCLKTTNAKGSKGLSRTWRCSRDTRDSGTRKHKSYAGLRRTCVRR